MDIHNMNCWILLYFFLSTICQLIFVFGNQQFIIKETLSTVTFDNNNDNNNNKRSSSSSSAVSTNKGADDRFIGSVASFNGSSRILIYKNLAFESGLSFSFRTCKSRGTILAYNSSNRILAKTYEHLSSAPSMMTDNNNNIPPGNHRYHLNSNNENAKNSRKRYGGSEEPKMDFSSHDSYELYLSVTLISNGYLDTLIIITDKKSTVDSAKTIQREQFLINTTHFNDNKWHSIEMRIRNNEFVQSIDHVIHSSFKLNEGFASVYYQDSSDSYRKLNVLTYIEMGLGFTGCLQQGANVIFNSEIAFKNIVWDDCHLEHETCAYCDTEFEYCLNQGTCNYDNVSDHFCQCKAGYEGRNCQILTRDNACLDNPCLNGGICQFKANTTPNFECRCSPGYDGYLCSNNIDECKSLPCQNDAICIDLEGSFKCVCKPNFSGTWCQYHRDPCGSKPCLNGATCNLSNDTNNYQCTCPPFYTGQNCEIPLPECVSAQCPLNSYCFKNNGEVKCKCLETYTGANCDIDVNECQLNSHLCDNSGFCTNEIGSYRCTCPSQWNNCTEQNRDPCQINPCTNNGNCVLLDDNVVAVQDRFRCECQANFGGKYCEIYDNPCVNVVCPKGKFCRNRFNSFECVCPTGFEGQFCNVNVDDCQPNPCHNEASCVDDIDSYHCVCAEGYKGRHCEEDVDECAMNICPLAGMCTNTFGSYKCYCVPGFTGKHCDINFDDCASHPCQNGGICTDLIDNYACVCKAGFTGKNCEINIDECASNPCLNDANCTDLVNEFKCICQPGFTGEYCQINVDECQGQPCLNSGKCIDKINEFQCICDGTGYEGNICEVEVNECKSDPCLNGGTCIDQLKAYTCNCTEGFEGVNCQIDVDECLKQPCQNGGMCHQRYTNITIVSDDGSAVNKIQSVTGYDCICSPGFEGANCETNVDECAVAVSANQSCVHGECIDSVNDFNCQCNAGYEGKLCELEINECLRHKPCLNGANCRDLVNDYKCKCRRGFAGRDCEIELKGCTDHLCPEKTECIPYLRDNDGTGSGTEHVYECQCLAGFAGKGCDIVTLVSFYGTNYSSSAVAEEEEVEEIIQVSNSTEPTTTPEDLILNNTTILLTTNTVAIFSSGAAPISLSTDFSILSKVSPDLTPYHPAINLISSEGSNKMLNDSYSTTASNSETAVTTFPTPSAGNNNFDDNILKISGSGSSVIHQLITSARRKRSVNSTNVPPSLSPSSSFIKVTLSNDSYYTNKILSGNSSPLIPIVNVYLQFTTTLKYTNVLDFKLIDPNPINDNIGSSIYINLRISNGKLILAYLNVSTLPSTDDSMHVSHKINQDFIIFESASSIDRIDWQTIILNITDKEITMDTTLSQEDLTFTFQDTTTVYRGVRHVQLGGSDDTNKAYSLKNFIGCMRDIYVNEKLIMPNYEGIVSNHVFKSCSRIKQCYDTSCSGNGQCIDNWYSYSCICRRPHHGDDCQLSYDEITFNHERNHSYLLIEKSLDLNINNITDDTTGRRSAGETSLEHIFTNTNQELDVSFFIKTKLNDALLFVVIPSSVYEKNEATSTANYTMIAYITTQGNLQVDLFDVERNKTLSTLTTDSKLTDETYPFVRVLKVKNHLQAIISKTHYKKYNFFPQQLFLNFDVSKFFMGSFPHQENVTAKYFANLGKMIGKQSFKGSIWDLRLGNETLPLANFTLERGGINEAHGTKLNDQYTLTESVNLTLGSPSDNNCQTQPCLNKGECIVTWNDFTCLCDKGYRGKTCETFDPCDSLSCPSGTFCSAKLEPLSLAECQEIITFDGIPDQGIKYKSISAQFANDTSNGDVIQQVKISFYLRTRTPNFVLFYLEDTTAEIYLAIVGIEGKIAFLYRSPQNYLFINNSNVASRGEWFHVSVTFSSQNVTVDVQGNLNNYPNVSIHPQNITSLLVNAERIYLGPSSAIDSSAGGIETKQYHMMISNDLATNFMPYKGCFSNLKIVLGGQDQTYLVPLSKDGPSSLLNVSQIFTALELNGLQNGCVSQKVCHPDSCKNGGTCTDIFDAYNCTCPPGFNGSVCQHNIDDCNPYPCVNGVCVDGINSYECQCQPGYTGKRCDIKIDPCSYHNCLNNGVCKQFGDINYTCACDGPFVGDFCQIPIDYDCSRNGNICANNATCETGYFLLDNNKTVTFKCVCPSGFDGLLCDTERNFCKSNKCVYGECHSNRYFENYTCDCKIGYTGKYCDQDLDECLQNVTSLCLNGGTCRNNIGNYTCECLKGWTGPRCKIDIDECLEIGACLHTGTCKNTEGEYSCNCSGTGYEGKTCEVDIDECSEEASKSGVPKCTDNGRCVNEPGFYRCECHQGYSGSRCESANCSLIRCENNGTCQINADDNTWRCICSNNSYGLFCENLSSCLNKPCKSGICYNIPNIAHGLNYTCECDANHTGPNCTEPNGCLTQPCGAGATCLNIPNQQYTNMNYTCVCPPQNNSSGPHCEPLDHCLNNLCVNGDCVSNGFNYTCKCLPGYSGTFCSINTDECQVNPCNNSGRCVDGINSYKCICDGTGFQGTHCDEDIDECLNNPCRNNGSCVNLPGSYRCDCPEYLGDDCEIKNPCAPNPCFNGGKCKVAITNEYTIAECVCPEPFLGELCQNDPRVKPLKVTSPHKRTTYIVAPLSATILFAGLVSLIAFMLTAKKKRATRGAYSPSKQEINGPSVTLDHVLKPPPEERLI